MAAVFSHPWVADARNRRGFCSRVVLHAILHLGFVGSSLSPKLVEGWQWQEIVHKLVAVGGLRGVLAVVLFVMRLTSLLRF